MTVREKKTAPHLSAASRHLSVERKFHFGNEKPNDAGLRGLRNIYSFCSRGETCVWQALIGAKENGDSRVGLAIDAPPPASPTCNSSRLVPSPPAGPPPAQARRRARKNPEGV